MIRSTSIKIGDRVQTYMVSGKKLRTPLWEGVVIGFYGSSYQVDIRKPGDPDPTTVMVSHDCISKT